MGAGPITGGNKLRLLWLCQTLFGTELALPSKDEVFRAGNPPFLGLATELSQTARKSQCLLNGLMAKRETWDRLLKYRCGVRLFSLLQQGRVINHARGEKGC